MRFRTGCPLVLFVRASFGEVGTSCAFKGMVWPSYVFCPFNSFSEVCSACSCWSCRRAYCEPSARVSSPVVDDGCVLTSPALKWPLYCCRLADSISDHLQFDSRRQTLTVYRHKICLSNHLDSIDRCPIPKGVLGEILDTLNLLFPFGDLATKQLLIKLSYGSQR